MRPMALTLSNFRSYEGPVSIDLSPDFLAVVGENGHGKSSILKGIVWALWGEPKLGQDALVRGRQLGVPMCVEFEFSHQGMTYRVIRKRKLRPSGADSDVQLQISASGKHFNPIDSGSRGVQDAINALVGTYETFRMSCLIEQSQAGALMAASPADRLEIVARLLGLERYQRCHELANERRKEAAKALDLRREILRLHEEQAAGKQVALESVTEKMQDLEDICNEVTACQSAIGELEARRQELAGVIGGGAELQEREAGLRRELEGLEASRLEIIKAAKVLEAERQQELVRIAELEKKAARKDEITKLAAEEEQVFARSRELETARADRAEAERKLQAAKAERLRWENDRQWRIQDAKAEKERAFHQIDRWRADRDGEIQAKEKALSGAREQAKLIQEVPCGNPEGLAAGSSCDACLQCCKLLAKARAYRDDIPKLEAEIEALVATDIPESLRAAHETADRRIQEVGAEQDPASLAGIQEAETALAGIQFDQTEYDQIGQRCSELVGCTSLLRAIELAETELTAARQRAEDLMAQIADKERARMGTNEQMAAKELALSALREKLAVLVETQKAHGLLSAQIAEKQMELSELEEQRATGQQALGRAQEALRRCEEAARQAETLRAEVEELGRRSEILAGVCGVFSRNGLPAYLIEAAIPRINEEANSLLETMSGGRISVDISLLGSSKNGEQRTALSIEVSTADGGELQRTDLSGGEGQLVDVAVRIAVASIHAADGEPRVLFLDEVRGALDPVHRANMTEALGRLAESGLFGQIVEITHWPEDASQYPAILQVSKNGTGSCVELIA